MKDFYSTVVNCPLTSDECPYALKNLDTGDIPRGFSSHPRIHPDILVVRKNPGHADKTEKDYYRGKQAEELFNELLRYRADLRSGKVHSSKGASRFRTNELRYLLFILGYHKKLKPFKKFQIQVEEEKHIRRRVVFTNLFKCSTRDEQAKIPGQAFSVCYERYFRDELHILRPKLILAAGKEVYGFLSRRAKAGDLDVTILLMKHPSYFYSKIEEPLALRKIKHSVQKVLRGLGNR